MTRGYQEKMKGPTLFDRVMDNGLRDWFAQQDQARAAGKEKKQTRYALSVGGAILAGTAAYLYSSDVVFALFGAAMVVAGGFVWASNATAALELEIKAAANAEIARVLGLTYEYATSSSTDFRLATSLGLLPSNPDEEDHSDAWFGQLGELDLHLHESHLQEWVQRGKRRSLETVFHGVVLGYQFARSFSGTTIVQRDMGVLNALGAIGAKWGNSLERVRLVDPRFESAFEVYGSDQVEARYLVHPAFCERLLEMEQVFDGKNLRMVFAQGRVVIVIETGNLFETGGLEASEDESRVAQTLGQIQSLLTLSQTLNERQRNAQV
jgi:hypothetical protein